MLIDLKHTVQSKDMFENQTVVVALSGGVDSMVLFHVLRSLELDLVIAHVNHNIREASKTEQAYLRTLAKKENIPFETMTIEEPPTANFQAKAREIRYDFFERIAKKYKTDCVALAHHADDQIEHFFIHLVHHHNLLTLKGMRPIEKRNAITLARPLLEVSKNTLLEYAKKHDLCFFEDTSNLSDQYTRNRIRNHLLPLIEKENPNYRTAVSKHMQSLNDIEMILEDYHERLSKDAKGDFEQDTFLSLPYTVQKYILGEEIRKFNSDLLLSDDMIREILNQLNTKRNLAIPLKDDIVLRKEYGKIFVSLKQYKPSIYHKIEREQSLKLSTGQTVIVSREKKNHKTVKCYELWYNDKVFPLEVRQRLEGDYIHFSFGRKKVKDVLIDLKVPPHKRDTLIVLARDNEILWIPELDIRCHQNEEEHVMYIYFLMDNDHDLNAR